MLIMNENGEPYMISFRAARINSNMTQKEVASALHVSPASVCKWETEKVKPPFTAAKVLCDLYGLDMRNISELNVN